MTDPRIEAAARAYYWSHTEAVTGEPPTERQWKIVRETALRAMAAADRAAWNFRLGDAPPSTPVWCQCFEDHDQVGIYQGAEDYGDGEVAHLFTSQITERYLTVTAWKHLPAPPTEEIE